MRSHRHAWGVGRGLYNSINIVHLFNFGVLTPTIYTVVLFGVGRGAFEGCMYFTGLNVFSSFRL